MTNNMYKQNKDMDKTPTPTVYNTPKTSVKNASTETKNQEIKLIREAHVTEITLGNETLRVMDAGHIQGVINMMEKHDSSIKQLQKTANTQNRSIISLSQQINILSRELDEIKAKFNGNFL